MQRLEQSPQTTFAEHSPQLERPEDKKESIFAYYDVPNEIDFIDKIKDRVGEEDRTYLIQENVYRFLGEFAGKVPYTTIAYTRTDDGLSYAGIDLMDSYRNTAEMTAPHSRERDELVGYEKIAATMANGAQSATWISPPKIADYGFAFHFERNPENDHIKEYILRYDENRGELGKSAAIQEAIDPVRVFDTDSEYLHNPYIGFEEQDCIDIEHVMGSIGIDVDDIRKSQLFEQRVQHELSSWVEMYTQAIETGQKETAEFLLTAIYNRAVDIKDSIDKKPGHIEIASPSVHFSDIQTAEYDGALLAQYAKKQAVVIGGGSCPSVKNKWNGDPLSSPSLMKEIELGKSVSKLVNEANEHFVCPKCDYHATGPVGNECPHCHMTKEEFAKQGGTVC